MKPLDANLEEPDSRRLASKSAEQCRRACVQHLRDRRVPLAAGSPLSATVPLTDLWFDLSALLSISPTQAADLAERLLEHLNIRLFGEDGLGRCAPVVGELYVTTLSQVWSAADSLQWDRAAIQDWRFLRLTLVDAESMKSEAARLYGLRKLEQAVLATMPSYLDPKHPRYAPKLAAAVQAWIAVEDPKGKTPKKALDAWLREHCVELGLADAEGKPNVQGIEECAKVANWRTVGGAPRTPGE